MEMKATGCFCQFKWIGFLQIDARVGIRGNSACERWWLIMEMPDGGSWFYLGVLQMCFPVGEVCISVGVSCEYWSELGHRLYGTH